MPGISEKGGAASAGTDEVSFDSSPLQHWPTAVLRRPHISAFLIRFSCLNRRTLALRSRTAERSYIHVSGIAMIISFSCKKHLLFLHFHFQYSAIELITYPYFQAIKLSTIRDRFRCLRYLRNRIPLQKCMVLYRPVTTTDLFCKHALQVHPEAPVEWEDRTRHVPLKNPSLKSQSCSKFHQLSGKAAEDIHIQMGQA